jgi:DNA-binding response OmpR family regulator
MSHKILAVDDDLYILELYKALFSEEGFIVETAEDAVGAMAKHNDFKSDLLILDVDMPGGGGQAVFAHVRRALDVCTPVIFSTGAAEGVAHLKDSPRVAILKKPVECGRLLAEVKRLLGAN